MAAFRALADVAMAGGPRRHGAGLAGARRRRCRCRPAPATGACASACTRSTRRLKEGACGARPKRPPPRQSRRAAGPLQRIDDVALVNLPAVCVRPLGRRRAGSSRCSASPRRQLRRRRRQRRHRRPGDGVRERRHHRLRLGDRRPASISTTAAHGSAMPTAMRSAASDLRLGMTVEARGSAIVADAERQRREQRRRSIVVRQRDRRPGGRQRPRCQDAVGARPDGRHRQRRRRSTTALGRRPGEHCQLGVMVEVYANLDAATGHYAATRDRTARLGVAAVRRSAASSPTSIKSGAHLRDRRDADRRTPGAGRRRAVPATLGNGSFVRVTLATAAGPGGVWNAVRDRRRRRRRSTIATRRRSKGLVSSFASSDTASASTARRSTHARRSSANGTAGLALGARVEIEGALRAGVARRVLAFALVSDSEESGKEFDVRGPLGVARRDGEDLRRPQRDRQLRGHGRLPQRQRRPISSLGREVERARHACRATARACRRNGSISSTDPAAAISGAAAAASRARTSETAEGARGCARMREDARALGQQARRPARSPRRRPRSGAAAPRACRCGRSRRCRA